MTAVAPPAGLVHAGAKRPEIIAAGALLAGLATCAIVVSSDHFVDRVL